ncbi:MAG: hypothetical protein EA397_12965 [Deltaproteobacteria bacterium]|nr:MAG: hypothetical protein EA397_12965 [Deltaproteobacteria bacterium]
MKQSGPDPKVEGRMVPLASDGTLAGLRPDDLNHQERRALLRVITSKNGSEERSRALALAQAVSDLPPPTTELHPADVLSLLKEREQARLVQRWRLRAGVGLFLVAGVITALLVWPGPTWDPGTLQLEARATSQGVRRAVGNGSLLPADAKVELSVAATGSGQLFIVERWGYDSTRVLLHGADAQDGPHRVTFEPSTSGHSATYQAWLCPPGADRWSQAACAREYLRLDWR